MTEGTDSESLPPRRALPRAARLSRLPRSLSSGDTDHGDTDRGDTDHGETAPAADGGEPDVPAAPALALGGPEPAESPSAAAHKTLAGPTKTVRNELVDLANAIVDAADGKAASGPVASGPWTAATDAGLATSARPETPATRPPPPSQPTPPAPRRVGSGGAPVPLQMMRDFQRPTAAFGGSTVRFRPVEDPSASRAVIVSSFGLLVCFFPVLSLFGLLLGAISMRRIHTSGGSLIGAKTARMAVILGAAGLLIGVAVDVALVISL